MNRISRLHTEDYYSRIASGKKLQKAADGAAELAISQKENAQIRGYQAGTRNAEDGLSALKVADGATSGIADQLQRMRELALQASNSAVVSDDERKMMQQEVEQLKQGISDIAKNTEFNTKKLLDGSNQDMYIASGANGEGQTIDTGNATLEALGIADFDLTGNFSVETIDNALKQLSETRSSIGAQSNALDATIAYNRNASYNLTNAVSRIEDTDIEETVIELNKQRTLETARFMMQNKQKEQNEHQLRMFYM